MSALNGESQSVGGGRDAWATDGFAPLPGDTIAIPGEEPGHVESVYLCAESSGDEVTRWSWIVLADGRLLEVAPRGCAIYGAPVLLPRGTGRYLELVAQDGALVRFEERVRAGTWADRPVRLTLDGRRWRLTSTGTVAAQRLGPAPTSAWSQLRHQHAPGPAIAGAGVAHVERPTDEPDVYFTFVGLSDPTILGIGLWATDVLLAFGRRLGSSPATSGLHVNPRDRGT